MCICRVQSDSSLPGWQGNFDPYSTTEHFRGGQSEEEWAERVEPGLKAVRYQYFDSRVLEERIISEAAAGSGF